MTRKHIVLLLWSASPELERAFLNTSDYCAARGIA